MDFTKLTKWSERARNLHEFLGDVLEGERAFLEAPKKTVVPHFEVREDIENALLVASRGRAPITFATRFTSLSPYFEAGFTFELTDSNETRLRSMFLLGRVFVPSEKESRAALPLPWGSFTGVRRGQVKPLLQAYQLEAIPGLADAAVFAVSVRPGLLVLLVCNRPHPWQVGIMEKAHAHLTAGLTLAETK